MILLWKNVKREQDGMKNERQLQKFGGASTKELSDIFAFIPYQSVQTRHT